MSDPNADFKTLLDLTGGVEVRSAEHPDDRRQRHRLEGNAVGLIGVIAAFSAAILLLSFFRPIPEKRADWALMLQAWTVGDVRNQLVRSKMTSLSLRGLSDQAYEGLRQLATSTHRSN